MSDDFNQELRNQRLRKLEEIKKLGLDPYPQPDLETKQSCFEASQLLDKEVTVAGRLISLRGHGKILFADLRDTSGKIQVFFESNTLGQIMDRVKLLDIGDIVSLTGEIFKTKAGEVTIRVKEFQILAKNLRPLPEKWHGLTDTEERYRQRYLDLIINPDTKALFLTRSKILTEIRRFLDDHGFIEVETPVLQPIYGGASAKPFITRHNELDQDMYLRISNELYLKRLIVGGFEKVYEVSRDFRNESVSRFHNPEFTQIEFYWAYIDYDVLMRFTEKLITHVIQQIKGSLKFSFNGVNLDFSPHFKRLTFHDAVLKKTGIDIDEIKTEKDFLEVLENKKIKLKNNKDIGLGALFDALYKEHVRPGLIGPVFLIDYPSDMIALAKRKTENPQKIASFQLLACGIELLKAYNELNDPKDQEGRWLDEEKLAKRGAENTMVLDTDYIRALEYGMPPTAGWGMGLDRLTQFLTDSPTIKDVILFPSLRNEEKLSKINLPGLDNLKIVIGKVISVKNHPHADNLKIFNVDIGQEKYNIISSCQNVSVGSIVPVALQGATVHSPDNKTLTVKTVRMRGLESPGMMCSPLEIGLGSEHDRIYLLPDTLSKHLGEPVNKHLKT